jgi:hypothetical protein
MVGTGCYARRICGFVQAKLCQRLPWHRTSPVTPGNFHLSFSCPIALLLMPWRRRGAADLCAAGSGNGRSNIIIADFFHAAPRRKQKCNGCWGRKKGAIGRLFTVRAVNGARDGRDPSTAASSPVRSLVKTLVSRVTTPTQMGAFFRNEGGRSTPTLPRMEEETQGVTPPFNEEVAWGRGGSLHLA